MIPNARKSSNIVMKIKRNAARVAAPCGAGGAGDDRGPSSESLIVTGNRTARHRFDDPPLALRIGDGRWSMAAVRQLLIEGMLLRDAPCVSIPSSRCYTINQFRAFLRGTK
jgi:hypothetical protein